jgi:hypothetical protein
MPCRLQKSSWALPALEVWQAAANGKFGETARQPSIHPSSFILHPLN